MNKLQRVYESYQKKWALKGWDFLWIIIIFSLTGMATVLLRRILTPLLWGEYRGWGYYVTMPFIFMSFYYSILLLLGVSAGYKRIVIPMAKRPLILVQRLVRWIRKFFSQC